MTRVPDLIDSVVYPFPISHVATSQAPLNAASPAYGSASLPLPLQTTVIPANAGIHAQSKLSTHEYGNEPGQEGEQSNTITSPLLQGTQ